MKGCRSCLYYRVVGLTHPLHCKGIDRKRCLDHWGERMQILSLLWAVGIPWQFLSHSAALLYLLSGYFVASSSAVLLYTYCLYCRVAGLTHPLHCKGIDCKRCLDHWGERMQILSLLQSGGLDTSIALQGNRLQTLSRPLRWKDADLVPTVSCRDSLAVPFSFRSSPLFALWILHS